MAELVLPVIGLCVAGVVLLAIVNAASLPHWSAAPAMVLAAVIDVGMWEFDLQRVQMIVGVTLVLALAFELFGRLIFANVLAFKITALVVLALVLVAVALNFTGLQWYTPGPEYPGVAYLTMDPDAPWVEPTPVARKWYAIPQEDWEMLFTMASVMLPMCGFTLGAFRKHGADWSRQLYLTCAALTLMFVLGLYIARFRELWGTYLHVAHLALMLALFGIFLQFGAGARARIEARIAKREKATGAFLGAPWGVSPMVHT